MSRRTLLRLGRLAVAVAIFAVLAVTIDIGRSLQLLADADPVWLVGAVVALSVQTVLSALRWRLAAARLGQPIGRMEAVGEYYLSQIVNQTLPGGMLGDAGRALRARHHAGLIRSGQAVVFERVAGQAVVFTVMMVSVLAVTLVPGGVSLPDWALWFAAAVPLGAVAAMLAIRSGAPLPGRAGRGARDMTLAFRRAVLHPRVLPWQILLSVGTTACNLLAFACTAKATGTVLTPVETLVIVPLILTTMLIPLTVSGWGVREGASAALFAAVGVNAAHGVAASVAFGLVYLVTVLPGLLLLLAERRAGREGAARDDDRAAAHDGAIPTPGE